MRSAVAASRGGAQWSEVQWSAVHCDGTDGLMELEKGILNPGEEVAMSHMDVGAGLAAPRALPWGWQKGARAPFCLSRSEVNQRMRAQLGP